MRYIPGKRKVLDKRLLVGGLLLLIVILIVVGLELSGVTHIFHKNPAPVVSGSSFNTKGEPRSTKESAGNSSGSAGTSSKSGSGGSPVTLIAPSGSFVSNHHPNLGGSPAPNTMSSVCNTTPGASCRITFTKDGVAKSLDAQMADANGATYWNWKLQDIGLTEGTWSIQASATLDGQTKTASDAMDLVVAQ
jgi:hypothetical protein